MFDTIKIDPLNFNADALLPAVDILKQGGVIAYPTETVYGLGADIFQKNAVDRIFEIKQRDSNKAISAMITSAGDVRTLCKDIPGFSERLMEKYWPGPLTLVFNASGNVPDYFVSGAGKIGLRLPDHPVTQALMTLYQSPITTTSANLSGETAAVSAENVGKILGDKVDLIIASGECRGQIASTVIDLTGEEPKLLREGAIPFLDIQQCLREVPDEI